jgi:hypothetical protein
MAEEAEITLNNNSSFALVQPFEAKTTSTNTSTNTQIVDVKPLTQTSTNTQTLDVKPLTQTVDQSLELKPVNIDSRQELAVTEPIRTDASSTLDLKPLVIDVCSRTGQASLPPTHVCQPYEHRIGFTVLGMELFGVTWSGESQTIVADRPGGPSVVYGRVESLPHRPTIIDVPGGGRGDGDHHHHEHHRPKSRRGEGKLRMKLTG